MFVAMTTYREPITTDHPLLPAHRAHLDLGYARGALVCSGPQVPRTGGVVIIRGDDAHAARRLMDDDPLVAAGLVAYELIRFAPSKALVPELIEAPTV